MLSQEARQRLRQLEFQSRRQVEEVLQGRYASLFKGQGVEFAEVREYVPGDDLRYLDWNVSARFGKPYVKLNLEERELTLIFLLDNSASMAVSGGLGSKADLAAQALAMLSFAALRFGHRVGLVRFAERVERYIEPQRGHQHVLRLLGEVLDRSSWGQGTDLEGALHFFNRVYPRRAVLFYVSDLLDSRLGTPDLSGKSSELPESLTRAISLCCRRHDLSVLRMVAPWEREMPAVGRVRWRDAETGQTAVINTGSAVLRRRYAANMTAFSGHWRNLLERSGGSYAEFSSGEELLGPLLAFMAGKKRRSLYR